MVRVPGNPPGSCHWQWQILLVNYARIASRRSFDVPRREKPKEQTPTQSKLRTAGQFPLAVFRAFQEARSPLKIKNPTPVFRSRVRKIFFS
jgi:hypothetical protein